MSIDLIPSFSQILPRFNVRIIRRTANGRELDRREGKNRVTKLALMGIIRMINGEFTNKTPEDIDNYVPHYLALGSNAGDNINPGVTSAVTVNDSRLLHEISPRIKLTQRNIIENRETNPFIKLTIRVFIPVDQFVGETIGEAGLFTKESGNNCWARIAFDPIQKQANEVLDVTWEITVMSVGNTVYPTSLTLDKSSLTINKIDQRVIITPTVLPSNSTIGTVSWESSDSSVVDFSYYSNEGTSIVVIPKKSGTCTMTARTVNDLIATCIVTVKI